MTQEPPSRNDREECASGYVIDRYPFEKENREDAMTRRRRASPTDLLRTGCASESRVSLPYRMRWTGELAGPAMLIQLALSALSGGALRVRGELVLMGLARGPSADCGY
jgi:hypothetical protein